MELWRRTSQAMSNYKKLIKMEDNVKWMVDTDFVVMRADSKASCRLMRLEWGACRVFSSHLSHPVYLIIGQGMTQAINKMTYPCFDMVNLSFYPVFWVASWREWFLHRIVQRQGFFFGLPCLVLEGKHNLSRKNIRTWRSLRLPMSSNSREWEAKQGGELFVYRFEQ